MVSEILQFYVLLTAALFHPNSRVFLLHQIAHVGVSERISLKLFGRDDDDDDDDDEFQPTDSGGLSVASLCEDSGSASTTSEC